MLSCMIMHDACLFQSGSYEKDQNAFWDSLPDRNSCCQGTIWHPKTIMIHPTSLWKSIRNQKLGCLCGFVEPVRHFKITFSCHARLQSASKTQVPSHFVFFWWVSREWDVWGLGHILVSLGSLMLLLWFLSPITFEARCHLWISTKRTSSFVCSSVIAWAWTSAPSAKQGVRIGAMELVASLKHGRFVVPFRSIIHIKASLQRPAWRLAIVYHHTSYHDEKLSLHKPTSTSLDTAQLPWDKKQGTVGRGTGCLGGGYSRPEKTKSAMTNSLKKTKTAKDGWQVQQI